LALLTAIGPTRSSSSSATGLQRHPDRDRASGVAQIPLQGRLGPADDGQRAGPERLGQFADLR
jgi:hypothetical protein